MPEINEPIAVSEGTSADKVLRAVITEVTFKSPIKVSCINATVTPPHWRLGAPVSDATPKKPAVYLVRGAKGATQDVEVKVNITEVKNVSGTGTLLGSLGGIQVRGQCSLSAGERTVTAKIDPLPEGVTWVRGDMAWRIEVDSAGIMVALAATRLELFFVLATPTDIYQSARGVWAEALSFLCRRMGVLGTTDTREAIAKITRYCHSSHGLKYDSAGGGRSRYGLGHRGGRFQLNLYMTRGSQFANCYDQAGAIQAFSGCLGIKTDWIFLEPFGYIKLTPLLGYGACNNPFFLGNNSPQVVATNDPRRTPFGNHAFCAFSAQVVDACAGPHLASESYAEYVKASIDSETSLYEDDHGLRPGTDLDMQWMAGITAVV